MPSTSRVTCSLRTSATERGKLIGGSGRHDPSGSTNRFAVQLGMPQHTPSYRLSDNFFLCFPVFERHRLLRLIWTQEPEHAMNRTHLDHRLARLAEPLVVPAVPPITSQPGERPLPDPPPRQLHNPLRSGGPTHHLDPVPHTLRLQ